jgi:hypothetical protein
MSTVRRKELSNWFHVKIISTILFRMLRHTFNESKFNKEQRLAVKLNQHDAQVFRLRTIAMRVARLGNDEFSELLPYLPRLDEFVEKPYTVDEIEGLCEESRRMLFPFEEIYKKYK